MNMVSAVYLIPLRPVPLILPQGPSMRTYPCYLPPLRYLPVIALALTFTSACLGQSAKPSPPYPAHLPYAFSNFVWWTDANLRTQLKNRIPGLGDEIAPTQATESRMRDAIKTLLRQKGIVADVMSEDPSPGSLTAERI